MVLGIVLALGLLFAGCVSQQPSPTPTPGGTTPPIAATPTPEPTVMPTEVPSATPSPSLSPAQQLSGLKGSVAIVLNAVFGKTVSFAEDKDPVTGAVTYTTGLSSNYFDLQGTVEKSFSRQWPPTVTLVEMQGESGAKKTLAFTQVNVENIRKETDVQMECNGFSQLIILKITESNTPSLPFQNLAGKAVAKLIDVCP